MFEDSSFPACTTVWGFEQALKPNLVLWENHAQGNISSLVQEKLTPVPKKVALCFSNHLKEVLNRGETSVHGRCYESGPNRRIISSALLIRMATAHCQVLLLVNIHCETLTRFKMNQAMQPDFGKMVETSSECFSKIKTHVAAGHILSLHTLIRVGFCAELHCIRWRRHYGQKWQI